MAAVVKELDELLRKCNSNKRHRLAVYGDISVHSVVYTRVNLNQMMLFNKTHLAYPYMKAGEIHTRINCFA